MFLVERVAAMGVAKLSEVVDPNNHGLELLMPHCRGDKHASWRATCDELEILSKLAAEQKTSDYNNHILNVAFYLNVDTVLDCDQRVMSLVFVTLVAKLVDGLKIKGTQMEMLTHKANKLKFDVIARLQECDGVDEDDLYTGSKLSQVSTVVFGPVRDPEQKGYTTLELQAANMRRRMNDAVFMLSVACAVYGRDKRIAGSSMWEMFTHSLRTATQLKKVRRNKTPEEIFKKKLLNHRKVREGDEASKRATAELLHNARSTIESSEVLKRQMEAALERAKTTIDGQNAELRWDAVKEAESQQKIHELTASLETTESAHQQAQRDAEAKYKQIVDDAGKKVAEAANAYHELANQHKELLEQAYDTYSKKLYDELETERSEKNKFKRELTAERDAAAQYKQKTAEEVEGRIKVLSGTNKELATMLDNSQQREKTMNVKLERVKKELEKLHAKSTIDEAAARKAAEDAKKSLTDLEHKLSNAAADGTTIETLKEEVAEAKKKLTECNDEKSNAIKNNTELRQQLTKWQQKLARKETLLADVKGKNHEQATQLKTFTQKVKDKNATTQSLKAEVASQATEIETLKADLKKCLEEGNAEQAKELETNLKECEESKVDLQQKLAKAQKECENNTELRQQLTKWQQKFARKETLLADVEGKNHDQANKLKNFEQKAKEKNATTKRLRAEVANAQTYQRDAERRVAEKDEMIEELKSAARTTKKQLETATTANKQTETENANLEQLIENLKGQLKDCHDSLKQSREESEKRKFELDAMRLDPDPGSEPDTDSATKLSKAEQENVQLQDQLQEVRDTAQIEYKRLNSELEDRHRDELELNKRIGLLEQKIKDAQVELNDGQSKQAGQDKQIDELTQEISTIDGEKKRLAERLENTIDGDALNQQRIQTLNQQILVLKSNAIDFEQSEVSLQQKTAEIEEFTKRIAKQDKLLLANSTELAEYEVLLNKANERNDRDRNKFKRELRNVREATKNQIEKLEAKRDNLESNLGFQFQGSSLSGQANDGSRELRFEEDEMRGDVNDKDAQDTTYETRGGATSDVNDEDAQEKHFETKTPARRQHRQYFLRGGISGGAASPLSNAATPTGQSIRNTLYSPITSIGENVKKDYTEFVVRIYGSLYTKQEDREPKHIPVEMSMEKILKDRTHTSEEKRVISLLINGRQSNAVHQKPQKIVMDEVRVFLTDNAGTLVAETFVRLLFAALMNVTMEMKTIAMIVREFHETLPNSLERKAKDKVIYNYAYNAVDTTHASFDYWMDKMAFWKRKQNVTPDTYNSYSTNPDLRLRKKEEN